MAVKENTLPRVSIRIFFTRGQCVKTINLPCFYGRPGNPRNGFELGIAALKKLKNKMGDRVRILVAGANWEPSEYGLDGIVENLGL